MASPSLQRTDNENLSPAKSKPQPSSNVTNRRALSDVSPNVRSSGPRPNWVRKKATTGSPLKRSFTAVMASGQGFTYLKKRRLSVDNPLSEVDGAIERRAARLNSGVELNACSVLSMDHGSPTEPNTPSTTSSNCEDSSAERRSFSSLINYDQASQQSTTATTLALKPSNAEMLKLRLRVAMYKVRTNQIGTPFTELRVEDKAIRDSKLMSEHGDAVEEAVAQLRREAQERLPRLSHQAFPKLLSAPVLKPTAYSSRIIYEQVLPSSPPVPRSPHRSPGHLPMATPARGTTQLSSPPNSVQRGIGLDEKELTSSVVKGRVAEGLLGLRDAV